MFRNPKLCCGWEWFRNRKWHLDSKLPTDQHPIMRCGNDPYLSVRWGDRVSGPAILRGKHICRTDRCGMSYSELPDVCRRRISLLPLSARRSGWRVSSATIL